MLIATESAVFRLQDDAETPEELLDRRVRNLVEGRTVDVVADEDGRLGLHQEGQWTWFDMDIDEDIESMLILGEDPFELLVGTEPPYIYRVGGHGSVTKNESFADLHCRDEWHTPWGGPPAVRSLASSSEGWVYADIHVGSIMRSHDMGLTWKPVHPDLHEDVHQVATCASSRKRVYANTADAVWISDDHGKSWRHVGDDLNNRYGRAICVHPENPDLILASVSDGPHGDNVHGQLWVTETAGKEWMQVTDGFPESTRGNINTFHVLFDRTGSAWACVQNKLYTAVDPVRTWECFWEAPDTIRLLAAML